MDTETKKLLIDFFDPWELVELLPLTTEDIVEIFEEECAEVLDDLLDIIGVANEEAVPDREST